MKTRLTTWPLLVAVQLRTLRRFLLALPKDFPGCAHALLWEWEWFTQADGSRSWLPFSATLHLGTPQLNPVIQPSPSIRTEKTLRLRRPPHHHHHLPSPLSFRERGLPVFRSCLGCSAARYSMSDRGATVGGHLNRRRQNAMDSPPPHAPLFLRGQG